jgi:putative ABC transport system permease protein
MFKRYGHDIRIALESILANKLKSILTALGIIFGVAAVISMLAIGKGAQQEILDQIKMVGVNNILISPIVQEKDASQEEGEKQLNKFSRGLTLLDVEAIRSTIPAVKRISPEISFNSTIVLSGMRYTAKLVGVSTITLSFTICPSHRGSFSMITRRSMGYRFVS